MRGLIAVVALVCCAVVGTAWEWPLEDARIAGHFGANSGEHFSRGLDVVVPGAEVEGVDVGAASRGELVFAHDAKSVSGFASGLGSFVILEHEGELRSLYGHLARGSQDESARSFEEGERVGRLGSSGAALGPRVRFEVFDRELNRQVNPVLILPPRDDTRAPTISAVRVDGLDGSQLRVTAEVYDTVLIGGTTTRIGVQSVRLFVDGTVTRRLVWDTIEVVDGRELLGGQDGQTRNTVYADQWRVSLGPLAVEPDQQLRLEVEDLSGNLSSVRVVR